LTPRHAGLDDDRISFDAAMTGLQGLGQLLRQSFAVRDISPSGPPACDLLDASRLWDNPVYPVIPSK